MNIFNKIYFKIKYIKTFQDIISTFCTIFFSHIQKKRSEWGIAYIRSNWKKNFNISKIIKIPNTKNHWYADPFVVKKKKNHYIFFEDFSLKKRKGSISCIKINQQNKRKYFKDVVNENFHLSFPFIFKYNQKYFMIPESRKNNSLRLYKCIKFPNKWKFYKQIIKNINCVDPVIFKWNNNWILLTSKPENEFLYNRLYAYTSKNPISDNWKPLTSGPVIKSNILGRNAGLVQESNKKIYRISQAYLPGNYGAYISVNKVLNIFKNKYSEKKIKNIFPFSKKNIKNIHTLNYVKNFTVFDYSKWIK